MRLQPPRGPDPLHRRRRHANTGGHRPATPLRLARRRLMQRQPDDLLDLPAGIDRLRPRPGRTLEKSFSPPSENRSRHAFTVIAATPTSSAILVFAKPSQAINRTHARWTSRCGAICERISFSNTARCSSVTRSGAVAERITHPTATTNYLRDTPLATAGSRVSLSTPHACSCFRPDAMASVVSTTLVGARIMVGLSRTSFTARAPFWQSSPRAVCDFDSTARRRGRVRSGSFPLPSRASRRARLPQRLDAGADPRLRADTEPARDDDLRGGLHRSAPTGLRRVRHTPAQPTAPGEGHRQP